MFTSNEDLDCLYEAYLATPEGAGMAEILVVCDRICQPWMHKDDVQDMKKKILVQAIEFFTKHRMIEFEESEQYTVL